MHSLYHFIHRKLIVLNREVSVFQAARAMCANQIGCLLVGDNNGSAVGVVTDRDFACRWALNFGGKDVAIEQIMSRNLITADESDSLSTVLDLMERYGVRRIPIVRSESASKLVFVGIITIDDLLASHEIDADQLGRIIRRQIGRKAALLSEQFSTGGRAQNRSIAHRQQSLEQFYTFLRGSTGLDSETLPKVARFILGALMMRVPYTTASHLLAQLPLLIQEPLSQLPPGPDRSYTSQWIILELSTRFHFDEEQARGVLHRVLFSLQSPMKIQAMSHVRAQLPADFHPFFEPITLDALPPRTEPEVPAPPFNPERPVRHSFSDRSQAALELTRHLEKYRDRNPLVLGIPRGSVPMAKIVADGLNGDLDVALVHKIGAPGNPEYAIGSVSEFGTVYRSQAIEFYETPSEYIENTAQDELKKLRQRRSAYSPIRPPIDPKNRIVILVDDGIATGSTMLAAIRAIRSQGAKRIVVAAPVASPSAIEALASEADEIVTVESPEDFYSISQFYDEFPQVTDDEVLSILSHPGKRRGHAAA